jgi:hypothetical protein
MTLLRQRMIRDLQLRRLADRTQEAYVQAVAGLAKYYKLSPDKIDDQKVQAGIPQLSAGPRVPAVNSLDLRPHRAEDDPFERWKWSREGTKIQPNDFRATKRSRWR